MEKEIIARVSPERLQQLTLDLVGIRSYTGDTRDVASFYARYLEDLGLEVEVVKDFPQAPTVVARLRGTGEGPTLEFNGHIDTVPIEHPEPYVKGGNIYGRGTNDMKGGIAAMTEAVRVIKEAGVRLKGDLLVVAHGLHEAPTGHGEDLSGLIGRGVKGDAALVPELGADAVPVIGMGQGIFEFKVTRPGDSTHELLTPPGTPHPILAANHLLNLIQAHQAELSKVDIPYLGHESYFIGIFQGGDFFNRWTNVCRIVGTRRFHPDKTFDDVEAELRGLAQQTEAATGARVEVSFQRVREGFRVAESDPLVTTLRQAYQAITDRELPMVGSRMVGDVSLFVRQGKIPALYHGPGGQGSHGDLEWVPLSELVRVAQVYVLAALRYLGYN